MWHCIITRARPDNMVGCIYNRLDHLQGKRLEDVATDALNDLVQQHQVLIRQSYYTPRTGAHSSNLTALVVLHGGPARRRGHAESTDSQASSCSQRLTLPERRSMVMTTRNATSLAS